VVGGLAVVSGGTIIIILLLRKRMNEKEDTGGAVVGREELDGRNIDVAMLETKDNRYEVGGIPLSPAAIFDPGRDSGHMVGGAPRRRYEWEGDSQR